MSAEKKKGPPEMLMKDKIWKGPRPKSAFTASAKDFTFEKMFELSTRQQTWGIEGYEIHHKYADPLA